MGDEHSDAKEIKSETIGHWRIIEEGELSAEEQSRVNRLANLTWLLARSLNSQQRQKLLAGTGLKIEVGSEVQDINGRPQSVEAPDRMTVLTAPDGTRICRMRWANGELTRNLEIPSGSPVMRIEAPTPEEANEQADAIEATGQMRDMLAKRWMKNAEAALLEKITSLHQFQ